jgi:hypothetical protein
MQGKTGELWFELCAKAAQEQDPDKLLKLVEEINRLLQEKESRLQRQSNKQDAS